MKEAFGGIFNIIYVSIFLVIVIAILGLVVSYTKAFKMKNAIISVIEEYEGSGCYPESPLSPGTSTDTACRNRIKEKAQELAYSPVSSLNCSGPNTFTDGQFYCYEMRIYTKGNKRYAVFTVITQVDLSFPILEKIMGLRFFQVGGDTKEIQLTN